MDVEVCEMKIDDLAAVYHLGERIFTSQDHSNLYRTWNEYEVTSFFQSDPELCFVAKIDEKVAGFAMGTIIQKRRKAWNYGHLVWIGVDTSYHKMGIGDKLFDAFLDQLIEENVRILLVDTQADNEAAIRFFKKRGFANAIDHVYMSMNIDTHVKNSKNNKETRNHHDKFD